MRPISYVITSFIEKTMNVKGLNLFVTADGKYLAMDSSYDTIFKFDLAFSDNDFTCKVFSKGHTEAGELELVMRQSVNIPWTNGTALRRFFEYVRGL